MNPSRKQATAIALALLASFVVMSCSHTTRFVTDPEGARVYVNGVTKGKAPTFFETRSGIPATYYVKIVMPGYEAIETPVTSSYRADLSLLLLIPGIIPYFFSARLEDSYTFPLVSEEEKAAERAGR